jgi:hypothetical protein
MLNSARSISELGVHAIVVGHEPSDKVVLRSDTRYS